MKLHQLRREQCIALPVKECWEFFSDPGNLSLITPPDLGFKVLSEPAGRMYAGMMINYTVTPFAGIPVGWITEISHVAEPFYFVDEQRFGPYRFWHHQHLFRESTTGTEIIDIVHYLLPLGFISWSVAGLVRTRLDAIFDYRRMVLEQRFGV